MKNSLNIKIAMEAVVLAALEDHLKKDGTLKTLDWFNASTKTTDFYISLNKEALAS